MTAALRQHAPAWIYQLPALMRVPDPEIERIVAGTTPGRMLREISDALEVIARDLFAEVRAATVSGKMSGSIHTYRQGRIWLPKTVRCWQPD